MGSTNFHSIELEEPLRLDQLAAPYHLEQLHGRRQGKGTEAGVWLIGISCELLAVHVRRLTDERTPLTVTVTADGERLTAVNGVDPNGVGLYDLGELARFVGEGTVMRAEVEGAGDVLVCVVLRRPHAVG